jgi:hypothetical protein
MSAELTRSIQLGAWTSLGAIAYATLTHVGFVHSVYLSLSPVLMRPEMRAYVLVEHVGAFALFGAMFSFAYPRRTLVVCCFVFSVAVLLEYFQTLTPDRHGTLTDAYEKILGGAVGVFATRMYVYFRRSGGMAGVEADGDDP